jgi:hypothetical protein
MNRLLIAIATVALVTVFSMPASVTVFAMPGPAALTGHGPAQQFRDIPDVPRNAEANRQVHSTEQRSQNWYVTGQISDPAEPEAH